MDHPAARWRAAAASWHAIGSGSVELFFLWQQDLGDCAFVTTRSTVSRVCSGGLVLDAWSDQPPGSLGRSPGTRDQSPVGLGLRLHLDECRSFSPESSFAALVSEVARRVGVEPRALAVRALLHLPRTASYKGWVSRWQVDRELRINAERLRHDLRAARGYVPLQPFALRDLAFEEVHPSRALPVLTCSTIFGALARALATSPWSIRSTDFP